MKNFSIKKAIQVLGYFQRGTGSTDFLKLIKLCFFADRKMLRTFGMPVLFDAYYGMRHGPVCSSTKNILQKEVRCLDPSDEAFPLVDEKIRITSSQPYDAIRISDIGESSISLADKKCLDFVIDVFGKFRPFEIAEITHDYPEWKNYESLLLDNNSFSMNYADFFDNPTEKPAIEKFLNSADPFEETEENLCMARKLFCQNYEISN